MSPLFRKKPRGQLVALIDIESGSMGSALTHLAPKLKPRLFAQKRELFSPRANPSASNLFREVEKELGKTAEHLHIVAHRMKSAVPIEGIDRVAIFLHSPWAGSEVALERVVPKAHDVVLESLKSISSAYFGEVPTTFHSFPTTTSPIIHGMFDTPKVAIICSIGAEVTELSQIRNGMVVAHATTPVGVSTIVRTVATHAGISGVEARSILSLSKSTLEHAWAEAITSAMRHFARNVRDALATIYKGDDVPGQVFVLSAHQPGDWFARVLTEDDELHNLFSPGSTIRAVSKHHTSPHLSGHPPRADVPLMLESLFVDTRFSA